MKKDVKIKNLKRNLLKKLKEAKGITLITLVVTILIIIILSSVTINMVLGDNGLLKQAELAKDMAINSIATEKDEMNELLKEYANLMAEDSESPLPEEPDAPQDPLPTDGSFSEEKGVNTPKLGSNMDLVIFNEGTSSWVSDEMNDGYDYVDTSETGKKDTSRWANAEVTKNGVKSYFVWIPRYAYKITYYTDANKTTTSSTPTAYGTIDIKFINGTGKTAADGTPCKYASESPNVTQEYVVHPAFTNELSYGGWDSQIAGIWVGKYETSGSTSSLTVEPGVSSLRSQTIGTFYTAGLGYAGELGSHMLKNSEWGAVAYLTESKYGRNGTDVTQNTNSSYYTGGGSGTAYITNASQSSTGNVYGIYDLSGGAYEYVASYYNGSTSSNLTNYGGTFASKGGSSTKYATAYTGTSASSAYKYGDATYETSGWHSDNAYFVTSNNPFFERGGYYSLGSADAGVFCYYYYGGRAIGSVSFRIALVL